ncbi:hypothetical protein ABUW04_30785 [Streptacidiphilus sp. N1-10]|uniref:Guanylate cyclase domain-containing protein n=1 Tax=Streptacidiphilus jeojiensis TaxID=3229225 RepID=A0ABV6XWJ9_9ACTN
MIEPVNRTMLLLDIERFTPRDDVVQTVLRRTLNSVVDETLAAAGVERTKQYREDRGDGMVVLISADVAKTALLRALLTTTPELLHNHNRLAATGAQIRLRMVLAAGEVAEDPHPGTTGGLVGHDLNQAFRLLDSADLRAALAERSGQDCVLCVSEPVYQGVVRHGHHGIRPGQFRRVDVRTKDVVLPAWFHGTAAGRQAESDTAVDNSIQETGTRSIEAGSSGAGSADDRDQQASGPVFHFAGAPVVHGSVVGGDQHGVSGGRVSGNVVLGGSSAVDE